MKKLLWMIPLFVAAACASTAPRFESYPGEEMRTARRTLPYPYDAVWTGVRRVVDGYRVHTEDREHGVMLTKWKTTITSNTALLTGGGRAADDYGVSTMGTEQAEFELRNRLIINVIPAGDSTVVTVTNRFWARPYDVNNPQTTVHGNKAFSSRNFDTHEEHKVLVRIEEIAAEQVK